MTQQISVVVTGTASTVITGGKVTDPNGNVWDLPATVTIPATGSTTQTCNADSANPQAIWPGSNVTLTISAGAITGWNSAATAAQVTPPVFRTDFPEFANATTYPDALVQWWLTWAYSLLNAARFGSSLDQAAQLYAAHNIVLEARAQAEANKGAIPGVATGAINSKSIDKVSVGYDTAAVAEEDAGDWNQTIYGRRLWKMIEMFGMGPVVVGVGCSPPFLIGTAWPGPPPWPGWFG